MLPARPLFVEGEEDVGHLGALGAGCSCSGDREDLSVMRMASDDIAQGALAGPSLANDQHLLPSIAPDIVRHNNSRVSRHGFRC